MFFVVCLLCVCLWRVVRLVLVITMMVITVSLFFALSVVTFFVSVSLCCVHCHFNFFRCRHFIRWRWWWCCHHLFTFHLRINLFFITAFTICTATLLSPPVIRVTPVTDLSHLLFWRYFVIFRTQTITDTSHILKGLLQQQLFLNYRFRCFFRFVLESWMRGLDAHFMNENILLVFSRFVWKWTGNGLHGCFL